MYKVVLINKELRNRIVLKFYNLLLVTTQFWE